MTSHPTVERYLMRLEQSMRDLPASRRREIVEEIREHIDGMMQELGRGATEAEVRNLLDQVGDPEDIAAEARERFGIRRRKPSWADTAAVILLPIGGLLLPVFGWIIAVVLLWISDVWDVRDKLLGTLVVPGGLVLPIYLLLAAAAPAAGGGLVLAWILLTVLVIAPIAMAVYLGRKLQRARLAAV